MKKPYLIALTGGIGSGKTTVLNLFKDKGIPCYIADEEAKCLMVEDNDIIMAIKDEFGEEAYTDKNKLNTSFLSSEVFHDNKKLEKLNNIVHPAVRKHFNEWAKVQQSIFVIYESALIFEYNQQHFFDEIILVTAPVEERIKRVEKRSGLSKKDVKNRIKRQMDDELKKNKVNYIVNNLNINDAIKEVDNIYNKILLKNNK